MANVTQLASPLQLEGETQSILALTQPIFQFIFASLLLLYPWSDSLPASAEDLAASSQTWVIDNYKMIICVIVVGYICLDDRRRRGLKMDRPRKRRSTERSI